MCFSKSRKVTIHKGIKGETFKKNIKKYKIFGKRSTEYSKYKIFGKHSKEYLFVKGISISKCCKKIHKRQIECISAWRPLECYC